MLWTSTPKQFNTLNSPRKQSNSTNIKTTLSKPDDPQPPADSVDAVLLLKTYHEIAHPIALLSNLRLSRKPGAKTGIIDRNGNGKITASVKNVVIREAAQAGYDTGFGRIQSCVECRNGVPLAHLPRIDSSRSIAGSIPAIH
jgi:hypothetical protein